MSANGQPPVAARHEGSRGPPAGCRAPAVASPPGRICCSIMLWRATLGVEGVMRSLSLLGRWKGCQRKGFAKVGKDRPQSPAEKRTVAGRLAADRQSGDPWCLNGDQRPRAWPAPRRRNPQRAAALEAFVWCRLRRRDGSAASIRTPARARLPACARPARPSCCAARLRRYRLGQARASMQVPHSSTSPLRAHRLHHQLEVVVACGTFCQPWRRPRRRRSGTR